MAVCRRGGERRGFKPPAARTKPSPKAGFQEPGGLGLGSPGLKPRAASPGAHDADDLTDTSLNGEGGDKCYSRTLRQVSSCVPPRHSWRGGSGSRGTSGPSIFDWGVGVSLVPWEKRDVLSQNPRDKAVDKYRVTLEPAEREELERLISVGKGAAR